MFDLGIDSLIASSSEAENHKESDGDPKPIDGLLGDFRIIREIGRGGMGIVYEAEQLSLNRQIALKVLPLASTLNEKHLQRFRNEAYAAASLNHPHIVDVYAVGVERGVNYMAMKYVAGQDLAKVLREVRENLNAVEALEASGAIHQASGPREALISDAANGDVGHTDTIRAKASETFKESDATSLGQSSWKPYLKNIVRIFIDAAEAIDYAHQQGVVHRDLKPSNLMLDEWGRVWIADFGLAQMERATEVTMTGDLLGTIRYMSPEQASGERHTQDHRTDIYSLGVTLYEALALRPAFQGSDRVELIHRVREGNLPSLRAENPRIPRSLEVIVGKATATDPNQRYATAQQLADDLRRHADGLAIKAKPPTLLQRTVSWGRVHPVATACVVVLFLSIAIFSSVTTALLLHERGKTVEALQLADRGQREAEFRAQETDAVLSFMLDDLLASLSPNRRRGARLPADQLLDKAGRLVNERFGDQPRVKASVLHMLGRLNRSFGRIQISREQFEAALVLRKDLLGAKDPSTLDTEEHLGALLANFDEHSRARELLQAVYQQRLKTLGAKHARTLNCERHLASHDLHLGNTSAAEKRYRKLIQLADENLPPDHVVVWESKQGLAMCLRARDEFDEAVTLLLDAIETMESSNAWGPSHLATLEAKRKLAFCYVSQLEFEQAEAILRALLDDCRRVVGDEHPTTSDALNLLGVSLRHQKKYDEAKEVLEESLRIEELLYGSDNASVSTPMNNLATLYQESGDWRKSIEMLERGLVLQQSEFGEEHPVTLSIRHNLARAHLNLSEIETANAINEEVLEIRERILGKTHSQTLKSMNLLAIGNSRLGNHEQALELHREVYEGRSAIYGATSADTLTSKLDVMEELFHLRRFSQARKLYRELERESRAALGPEHPDCIWKMIRYAQLMSDAGYHLIAALKFREVVELRFRSLGRTHPDTINAMKDMAIIANRLSPEHHTLVLFLLYWTEPSRLRTIPSLAFQKTGEALARLNVAASSLITPQE